MFNCQFCNKLCKNKNSLSQHQIRCLKNENKIEVTSNFLEYNKKLKNGELKKEFSNQYVKAEIIGLEKPIISDDTRKKLSIASKKNIWSNERKEKHSLIMTEVAKNNPDSYSANNVCGRTKLIDIYDSFGNLTKVNGSWELLVANYLTDNNIKWTNKIDEIFVYPFNGKERRYYPDFYLPELDKYIEVKGYERERDRIKWLYFTKDLIIIKLNEINLIKNKCFNVI